MDAVQIISQSGTILNRSIRTAPKSSRIVGAVKRLDNRGEEVITFRLEGDVALGGNLYSSDPVFRDAEVYKENPDSSSIFRRAKIKQGIESVVQDAFKKTIDELNLLIQEGLVYFIYNIAPNNRGEEVVYLNNIIAYDGNGVVYDIYSGGSSIPKAILEYIEATSKKVAEIEN